ncbi:MAG: hypothetical protein JO342_11200 [Solirubrobacterales bacterium]|nr:hypothetical protein [Solirubrobacterales bacterium]
MASRRSKQFHPPDLAEIARSNPYIHRLIEDAKLRRDLGTAADSLMKVYNRVSNGNVSTRSLLEDKKTQAELRRMLESARDATLALTEPPKKRRRLRLGRLLVLAGIGSGAALAASEKLRSKVLDLLFGAEEEFQYTPPPSTAPADDTAPVEAAVGSPADTAPVSPADTAAESTADTTTESTADTATATGTETGSAPSSS